MDEITIKSQKIKLSKKFAIALVALVAIAVALIVVAFSKFQTYKENQKVAVDLTLAVTDEFDKYKNDYNKMVEEMYHFYAPNYVSYEYKGYKVNNKDAVEAAREADEKLGALMSDYLGYNCYIGSKFLRHTEFFDYFFNYYYDDVNEIKFAFDVVGIIFVVVLLLFLVYLSYRKELIIDGDVILCNRGKKTAKQFMLKDVKSVQNIFPKGIKISGSGLRYSILLVNNRAEIQKVIMDKISELAVKSEQNLNAATNDDSFENIRKLKELLDCGAITSEEYEAKKKQLLGL